MALIPQSQNTNVEQILAEAGGGSNVLIPAGEYKGVFLKSEMKDTKTGGKFLAMTLAIVEGPYLGTEFTERLNLVNDNAVAVKIAFETLARISKALGMTTIPQDSAALHNKQLIFKVVTEAGKPWTNKDGVEQEGKDKSVIDSKGYATVGAVGMAVGGSTATSAAPMPWQS